MRPTIGADQACPYLEERYNPAFAFCFPFWSPFLIRFECDGARPMMGGANTRPPSNLDPGRVNPVLFPGFTRHAPIQVGSESPGWRVTGSPDPEPRPHNGR
jgi:hypothetical protein